MSRWEDQFNKHAIHKTIADAELLINTEQSDLTAEAALELRRAQKVFNTYKSILAALDAELVPFNILDALNSQIRNANVWNNLKAYSGNGNSGNLQAANEHLTPTISNLAQLLSLAEKSKSDEPLRPLEKCLDGFVSAVDANKETLKSQIAGYKAELTKQQQDLQKLSASIDQKKKETDQLISDWQKQFSDAQNKRGEEFSSDQKSRVTEFNQWRKDTDKEITDSFDALLKDTSTEIETAKSGFQTKMSEHLTDAEQKHKSILELYQLTAADSVGAGYTKNADNERDQADFWRWATVAFVALTAIWTGASYFLGPLSGDDSGTVLLGKVIKAFSVTGVLLFGAVYSAKQSNAHRANERRHRRFALEVKAIDPFIASLDEGDQKALKRELSERLFGQQDSEADHDGKVIEEHAFSTVVKGLIDVLKASK